MTYSQLPRQPKPGVTLYCPVCDAHFSAYRGDYFTRPPDEAITCGMARTHPGKRYLERCNTPLVLVQRHHAPLSRITPEAAEEPQP